MKRRLFLSPFAALLCIYVCVFVDRAREKGRSCVLEAGCRGEASNGSLSLLVEKAKSPFDEASNRTSERGAAGKKEGKMARRDRTPIRAPW